MKGLELCRLYWEEIGRPGLEEAFPELADRTAASVVRLADRVGALVAVTNEFPLDGPGYDAATRKYARVARAVNAALRAAADRVEELPEKEEERP